MRVMAFNGSPRKSWNTATLLEEALAGAASKGADCKLVHLYDLDYKGCSSCFACMTKGGKSYGRCAQKDGLTPILAEIEKADTLILGSPIYFARCTGEMRSFMERMWFPYLEYSDPWRSSFPRKINTAMIYTMNITEAEYEQMKAAYALPTNESIMQMIFGASESLYCFDTYQFKDYSKVMADRIDVAEKNKRREEIFPQDRRNAFELGVRLTQPIQT